MQIRENRAKMRIFCTHLYNLMSFFDIDFMLKCICINIYIKINFFWTVLVSLKDTAVQNLIHGMATKISDRSKNGLLFASQSRSVKGRPVLVLSQAIKACSVALCIYQHTVLYSQSNLLKKEN